MASLFEPIGFSTAIEENATQVSNLWQQKVAQDREFSDVAVGPEQLILSLAETLRLPQDAERGPDRAWNDAIVNLVGDTQTIGVIGCKLRYLVAAIEEVVLPAIPQDHKLEFVVRLHRASFFGLESVARAAARHISSLAFYSVATGLHNKHAFKRDVTRLVSRHLPFRIIYIDMDGLKIINDTQGHEAGDRALGDLGKRLSRELGEGDTAYHFSGDEFVVLAKDPTDSYGADLMSRVTESGGAGFSHGSAEWPDDSSEWDEVVNLADTRMQENKRRRKDRGEVPERPQ